MEKFMVDLLSESCLKRLGLYGDIYLQIWKNRKNLNSTNNVKAYLTKGFRMIIIDNKRQNVITTSDSEITDENLEFQLSIEDIIIENNHKQEKSVKMFKALDEISPRQKEAIYLKYLKGLEYHEISSIMDINLQSARNLVFSGLNALREKIQ
jgi:RNA polymerase sigma factor (sigma-70 family)